MMVNCMLVLLALLYFVLKIHQYRQSLYLKFLVWIDELVFSIQLS